jgi:hypothetical protein
MVDNHEIYEAPKVEATVSVEALLTWGPKRRRNRRHGGHSNHS